jgi:hypothetical protein
MAVGDGGIGPPLLERAPVLQTGRGTTRASPDVREVPTSGIEPPTSFVALTRLSTSRVTFK